MAILSSNYITILDAMKNTGDSAGQSIAEVLNQVNPILSDANAIECNMGLIHRQKIRTGLPSVAWGALYKGTVQSKATQQQVDDTTGFIEGISSVDTRMKSLFPNWGQYRANEASAFLEAMAQEAATQLFYGNTDTSPEKIKGLATRYAAYGTTTFNQGAENMVIPGGGAGADNTSIWFVTWGENYTSLLYPKGTSGGIQREDMGKQRVVDPTNNGVYYVEEDKFTWHMGVGVKDWRYNARIANLSVAALAAGTVDVYKLMTTAYYRLQSRRVPNGRQFIYMNRTVLESLDQLANGVGSAANAKLQLRREDIQGKEVLTWRGIPIRETDALLNTEALVPVAS
jgi:hypothetical protein